LLVPHAGIRQRKYRSIAAIHLPKQVYRRWKGETQLAIRWLYLVV
jgi:hypothetical protein